MLSQYACDDQPRWPHNANPVFETEEERSKQAQAQAQTNKPALATLIVFRNKRMTSGRYDSTESRV